MQQEKVLTLDDVGAMINNLLFEANLKSDSAGNHDNRRATVRLFLKSLQDYRLISVSEYVDYLDLKNKNEDKKNKQKEDEK